MFADVNEMLDMDCCADQLPHRSPLPISMVLCVIDQYIRVGSMGHSHGPLAPGTFVPHVWWHSSPKQVVHS